MKLHLESNSKLNLITGYEADHILINKLRHDGNRVVLPNRVEEGWAPGGFDALVLEDFKTLAALGAEVVLIGTGRRQRFPDPALLRPLMEARIGFEVMDLAAACRTYNILAAEGRMVAAALLFDPA